LNHVGQPLVQRCPQASSHITSAEGHLGVFLLTSVQSLQCGSVSVPRRLIIHSFNIVGLEVLKNYLGHLHIGHILPDSISRQNEETVFLTGDVQGVSGYLGFVCRANRVRRSVSERPCGRETRSVLLLLPYPQWSFGLTMLVTE